MSNDCGNAGCDFTNTGQCLLHGIEVERREHLTEQVKGISDVVKELTAFMNNAKGMWVSYRNLGILIILGSYSLALVLFGITTHVNDVQDQKIDKLINASARAGAEHKAFLQEMKAFLDSKETQ